MDNELYASEGRSSRRDRLMGKFFKGKEKKVQEQNESRASLDAFLHNSADNLTVTHAPPPLPPTSIPKLSKLDTTVSRFPQALGVNQQAQQNRPLALSRPDINTPRPSPRPNKKGLLVRFADTYPEVIGEGGDETDLPTVEISKRKKSRPAKAPAAPTPPPHRSPLPSPGPEPVQAPAPVARSAPSGPSDDFQPKPLARTQTGYSSIYAPEADESARAHEQPPPIPLPRVQPPVEADQQNIGGSPPANTLRPGRANSARYLDTTGRNDEARRSFIEVQRAHMRQDEGQALARASRTVSAADQVWEDSDKVPPSSVTSSPEQSRQKLASSETDPPNPSISYSPAASIHSNESDSSNAHQRMEPHRQTSVLSQHAPPRLSSREPSAVSQNELPQLRTPLRQASFKLHDVVVAATDDALQTFVARTKHLFELFRLHAETVKPLSNSALKDCARAGVWWFLKGRMGLETTIREKTTTSQHQMQNEIDRQQAYTNLAKGYWLCAEIVPEIAQVQGTSPDDEVAEVTEALVSALKKLSMSMKRNGLLPPEEAFLPQTIDKSIWVEYPPLSQDLVALLSGNWGSGLSAMQHPLSTLHLLDALPVSDSADNFSYGRVAADVYLMEQGRESQRLHLPSMVSMVRPKKHTGLVFVLANQNGTLQLAIQENKNAGPVWDDIRWRSDTCALDIKLPRGFMLVVQLTQQDFRSLWNMYDFGAKVKATLYPKSDEVIVFRNTLKSFQYVDADPNSRIFPKEAVPHCEVALFERIFKESGPQGIRNWHRGFRVAIVTGTLTRTLSGVQHNYPPSMPVQFGFFRVEGEAPALSLRFENGRQRGRMNLTFNEDKERIKFHSLLTGTALDHDEQIYADVALKSVTLSQSLREPLGMSPFSRMPWKAAKVVNEEPGPSGEQPPTVLADKLKMILEYQNGTIADRINIGPGELRLRLEVTNAKMLRIMRQPQADMTMAVSEAQVPKELPRNFADALQLVKMSPSIRSLEFGSLKDLHSFQAALTGYEVVFDALAATFAIARRRMVVPIHKKWEASYTRIQLVKQDDKLQLLAFFEDFHHGHCMGFVLKGTDVYETFNRSNKSGLRFIDAKFPLPRLPVDKDGDYDDMAFVSLDLPDLPGEHDDISITFENETDRDNLVQCLPAPVKGPTRMSSRLK